MKLPPLNAIKAFEATAHCGGFTAAASELGVSAAAVSLQARKAEEFLGKQLFLRHNNSLTLTDAGRMLYPQVAQSLGGLASIAEQFLEYEASYPTWAAWFRKAGTPRFPDLQKGLRVAGTGVAIEMAVRGAGITLASLQLSAHHLKCDELIQIESRSIPMTFGYYAITANPDKLNDRQIRNATYVSALLQEIIENQC